MKNVTKLVLVALFAVVSGTAMAQQVKLGFINSSELFQAMPEREAAFTNLEAFVKDFEEQLEQIQVEFNNKLQDYQKNSTTLTEAARTIKEKELQSISSRMQETQQIAEEEVQRKQAELLNPVFESMNAAIEKVAKANAITGVFDVSPGASALLYYDAANMTDLLPLVKAELGIN